MNERASRFARIVGAYDAALGSRDPASISILDLLPVIYRAVPDTSPDEIIAALEWRAAQDEREADQLERYRRAKFGNET
jgi:hypothetical protein